MKIAVRADYPRLTERGHPSEYWSVEDMYTFGEQRVVMSGRDADPLSVHAFVLGD